MTFKEKIMLAQKNNIFIPFDLANNQNIVGVYKIFGEKNERRTCLYIGKSTNIAYRLLGSGGGHIYMYLNNNLSKLVPCIIDKYIKDGYKIEIEINKVEYKDTSFSRAAHRLALAEISEIVKYQREGQCLEQMPEGVGMNEEKFWEENYKIEEINSSWYFTYFRKFNNCYIWLSNSSQTLENTKFVASELSLTLSLVLYSLIGFHEP